MKLQEFANLVAKEMKVYLKDNQKINFQKVTKNNGVALLGLTITSNDSNVAPTIYLESFFNQYKTGTSINKIAMMIWHIYEESVPTRLIDMSFYEDFEKVKDRIVYKLVNTEKNKNRLRDIPHVPFYDLSIIFYYAFQSKEIGDGQIEIRNEHMKGWGVSLDDLMEQAKINTPKLLPMTLFSVAQVLRLAGLYVDPVSAALQLYVLGSHGKSNGAAVLLYPDTLTDIANRFQSNFFIFPSSTHELLIYPYNQEEPDEDDVCMLSDLVHEVNVTQVSEPEILSDHVYFYDYKRKQMKSF